MRRLRLAFIPIILGMLAPDAVGQTPYRKPPKAVSDILDVPAPPALSLSPTRETVAFIESARYPSIADLAEPMLRLGGLRINPKTNGPAREPRITGITFQSLAGGEPRKLRLPLGKCSSPIWSPDGKKFALLVTKLDEIVAYMGDVATGKLVLAITGVNAVIGDPVQWMPDSSAILVQHVGFRNPKAPQPPSAPPGPTVQESTGKAAPVRTYQDLLKDSHDEALFDYYGTSVLAIFDGKTAVPVEGPGVFLGIDPSPDGKYLLVTRLKRPYSYLYPYSSFPKVIEVLDMKGKVVQTIADLPLQDSVPIEGVPTGPRGVRWVPTKPSTLFWVEALDGGDPKAKVPFRDQLYLSPANEAGEKLASRKLEHRFSGISFFETGNAVLLSDFDRDRKWTRTVLTSIGEGPEVEPKVVFDRSIQDRYNDPGSPLTKTLPNGHRVLRTTADGKLFLSGGGATPKGDVPFLDLFDPSTKKSERLFQCKDGVYEFIAAVLDDAGKKLLIRRESPTEPGNYYVRDGDVETALTKYADPFPELRKVKKQLVTTKRADGVTISFTLYLPPNVKEGEKLPAVFWAYPREFNTADTAGQVSGSPNRFVTLSGYSHLFFLTQGYAILDEVSVPIVGPPETANDTFIDQLVSSAKAAIDKACEIAPIDRDRIGVGGHSYGAFMTANLLAHSDLFRAGVARSGAYNRTLTPFGFQNERRTFWEAPEIYAKMSPFNNAHKVNEPLLLIHGQADSNPGTFPVQSERMYQAVRGNGGTVRLVLLPHEDHGYAAKESVEHVLAETIDWFDKYVKHAKPREPKGTGEKGK